MTAPAMPSLRGHFLIAMPHLRDPNFGGTVTFLCEHSAEGAMGLIVNRPAEVRLSEVLEQLDLPGGGVDQPVYAGGPLQTERGFVLHGPSRAWQSSMPVGEGLWVTTSRDVLQAIAEGQGPARWLVALGYAGWGSGQLEQEMASNYWLTCAADADILFDTPDAQKASAALGRQGIDYYRLAPVAGHD